ncbi:MAG: thioredoxin-disulfide reductase, partial [Pseudomonadota bacterium]
MNTDLIILGGGPAGLTAGLYACRARIPTVLIEKAIPGGQMGATELVENYPGFPDPILGFELSMKMEEHARKFGLEILQEDVRRIASDDADFILETDSGKEWRCRAVIIATGSTPGKLGIPGENELAGKGVSYCAVCDGPFFRNTEVAVVGGGDSAVEEALYLTRFADKVHIIHRRDRLRAVKEIQERAFAEPKIKVHWKTVPMKILGDKEVSGISLRNVEDQSVEDLHVGGVFFYVGMKPNTDFLGGLVETDPAGFVITDPEMACSRPGVFAAG